MHAQQGETRKTIKGTPNRDVNVFVGNHETVEPYGVSQSRTDDIFEVYRRLRIAQTQKQKTRWTANRKKDRDALVRAWARIKSNETRAL